MCVGLSREEKIDIILTIKNKIKKCFGCIYWWNNKCNKKAEGYCRVENKE